MSTGPAPPGIVILVPVYGQSIQQLGRCLDSVHRSARAEDSLEVVLDGPPAWDLSSMDFGRGTTVHVNTARLGLVGNWNRCFRLAKGQAIHLMHADDEVRPGFHAEAAAALQRWPDAGFVMAGADGERPMLVEPDAAARLLLGRERPPAGSTVFRRWDWGQEGPFSLLYPYCPDEELLPRLATSNPVALIPRDLYVEHRSDSQARRAVWREEDVIDVYWAARMSGVAGFSPEIRAVAVMETRLAATSVAAALIRSGERDRARSHLIRLARLDPRARWSARVIMAWMLASAPGGVTALRAADLLRDWIASARRVPGR